MSKIDPAAEELRELIELSEDTSKGNSKDRYDPATRKTLMLKKNIQRVELQGKRGKIKHVTTQITKELLEYIRQNFDGYSLIVLSYIILGALISIRKILLNAFNDTDEFLNEKLGIGKVKSKNLSRVKSKRPNGEEESKNKELTAESLRSLFNKSLLSEFERFKSSKFNLSMDLFKRIQLTLCKMKIPSMIGRTQQEIAKYEQENFLNPLKKNTEPLPNLNIAKIIKDSQDDTYNFANLVGVNVNNIINPEGILDNGQCFPNEEVGEINQDINTPEKENNFELIKQNIDKYIKDKNNIVWKKDKEFFEIDIPTYLEMTKEENEEMSINDIKKAFYKNLDRINYSSTLKTFKDSINFNKYNLSESNFLVCEVENDIKLKCIDGYLFFGNGKDMVSGIRNIPSINSDKQRFDNEMISSQKIEMTHSQNQIMPEIKGKTYNPNGGSYFNINDSNSQIKINSQDKSINIGEFSQFSVREEEEGEKEEKISSEIITELNKIIKKSKFYQNISVNSLVDNINDNTLLLNDYNEKQKNSFVFYNLLITCQLNGFNLQQNNIFADFFFVKDC